MASQPITSTPLFVTARRTSGQTSHVLLTDVSTRKQEGPFFCQVAAPNGEEAEGIVEHLDYAELLNLFARDRPLRIDRNGSNLPGNRRLRSVGLQLWSAGKPIELSKEEMELVRGAAGIAHIRLAPADDTKIDHVQVWSAPGAVTVTVWPRGGSLFPMPGLPNVQRKVRPVVLSDDLQCSAYWGFYRHSVLRAVRQLGTQMLAKVSGNEGQPSNDELIVATHYALNFLQPSRDLLDPLSSELAKRTDADSAILRWSIAFSGQTDGSSDECQTLFERAILTLNGRGCLYTEVFRMLVQRLGDGEEQWRDNLSDIDKPPDAMERAIQWARELAAATYWDAEHLTYRALDPRFPDANATDDQLGIGAKKKSAVIPLN